ncbi:MAG: ArnT family glycosyltransferase [Isosphaeraceae bacterium]
MSASSPWRDPAFVREAWVVAALTLVGGMLRVWSPGQIGLVHFDEGIYALAGLWILSPRGLLGLDPTTIAYAPPGFATLVGMAYGCLGIGDIAAVLVSIVMGTLTIPVVGWVAGRTFGRGAGASASAFAALSGPHIAFSRLALTDASFLLFWLLAVAMGHRFLERPNSPRALMLGVFVGLAQLFKYNGWIAGFLVVLGASIGPLFRRDERAHRTLVATWGWGLFAAMIAAIVYWPWFRFVESHGGYTALLAHQRRYLGGFSAWPHHLRIQLAQEDLLSGGPWWISMSGLTAAFALLFTIGDHRIERRFFPAILLEAASLVALCLTPHIGWWTVLPWFLFSLATRLRFATRASWLLLLGWLVLSILTPFYHPYARLMLPLQSIGWLFLGGTFAIIRSHVKIRAGDTSWRGVEPSVSLARFAVASFGFAIVLALIAPDLRSESRPADLFQSSDSLRLACRSISGDIPKDVTSLRLYARPPVTFYLSGTVPLYPQPGLERLLTTGDPRSWALLDMAMVRQEAMPNERLAGLLGKWDVVRDIPTTLNMPTLLDIDPAAVTSGAGDRSASLLLLRPRRPGEVR